MSITEGGGHSQDRPRVACGFALREGKRGVCVLWDMTANGASLIYHDLHP